MNRLEAKAGRPRPKACEVCGRNNGVKRLHYDHCHKTLRFRGWLCHGCNCALGLCDDNPEILRALAVYLERGAPPSIERGKFARIFSGIFGGHDLDRSPPPSRAEGHPTSDFASDPRSESLAGPAGRTSYL